VKAEIEREGIAEIEWGGKPYTLSKRLIDDGRDMLLLDKGSSSIEVWRLWIAAFNIMY
jgi:hypothetical protein